VVDVVDVVVVSEVEVVSVVVGVVLIRNTNPRVRIDQAVRFFWGPMTIISIVAIGLAWVGW